MSKSSSLYFKKIGTGSKIILCFHGFGQDHTVYEELAQSQPSHTFYLFDIYYHGQSTRTDLPLTDAEWQEQVGHFLEGEGIDRFSLLGFSLGGRFCISTLLGFGSRINQFILVAPDGIHKSFWYRLATSYLGHKLFRYFVFHPRAFDRFIDLAELLKIANPALVKFGKRELATDEKKLKVYRTWVYFRPLQVPVTDFLECLTKEKVDCNVILGNQDTIVRPQDIITKIQHEKRIKIHTINAKHHKMIEGSKELIRSLLGGEKS